MLEPYTKEAHAETVDWITEHSNFLEGAMGHGRYQVAKVIASIAAL